MIYTLNFFYAKGNIINKKESTKELGGHKPDPATTIQPKTNNTTIVNKSCILETN